MYDFQKHGSPVGAAKRMSRLSTLVLAAIAASGCQEDPTALESAASALTTAPGILIQESFNTTAGGFAPVSGGGTWGLSGGRYAVTASCTTCSIGLSNKAVHGTAVAGDFTLTVDGLATSTSDGFDDFGVIFNYQDANNYYFASFNETNGPNTHGLFKVSGGALTALADFTETLTPGALVAVRVEKQGSTIRAYRNGQLLATATDATFTGGKVGVGAGGGLASFDNFVVHGGASLASEQLLIGSDAYHIAWTSHDGFEGTTLAGWTKEGSSTVTVSGGRLNVSGTSAAAATLWSNRADLPANLIVRFRARATDALAANIRNFNLFSHAREADGSSPIGKRTGTYCDYWTMPNYLATFTYQHTRLRRNPNAACDDTNIKDEDLTNTVAPNTEYTVTYTVLNGRVRHYVDGRLIMDWTDPSPLPAGFFALRTANTNGWWDDVEFGTIEPGGTTPSHLIEEPFTSSAANFTVASGTWGLSGGRYVLSACTTDCASVHNTAVAGDFTLTVDATAASSTGGYDDYSIYFNYQDPSNYYYASFNETNGPNTHGIFKLVGGTKIQLADFAATITPGTSSAIRVEKSGSTISVYRDGVWLASATDTTFTGGKVGLGAGNSLASFDNLIVDGSAQPPPPPPPACDVAGGTLVTGGSNPQNCVAADFANGATSVSTAAGLTSALTNAVCNKLIIVNAGTYAGNFTLNKTCSLASPIVVKSSGAVTFTGRFTLNGKGLVLSGMKFSGGSVQVGDGSFLRATRNTILNTHGTALEVFGSDQLVDRNEMYGMDGFGVDIKLQGNAPANARNRISRNYIHHPVGTGNGHSGINIMTDSYGDADTLIDYNLLDDMDIVDEGEAISIKTQGVTVRGNTLTGSPMSGFNQRHGANSIWELNYVDGSTSRGILIHGDDHIARYNTVVNGGGLKIMAGDGTQDTRNCPDKPAPTLPNCNGVHPAARRVTVSDNTAWVEVGSQQGTRAFAANNTTVLRNEGSVTQDKDTNTGIIPGTRTGPRAVKLTTGDVGPGYPES